MTRMFFSMPLVGVNVHTSTQLCGCRRNLLHDMGIYRWPSTNPQGVGKTHLAQGRRVLFTTAMGLIAEVEVR